MTETNKPSLGEIVASMLPPEPSSKPKEVLETPTEIRMYSVVPIELRLKINENKREYVPFIHETPITFFTDENNRLMSEKTATDRFYHYFLIPYEQKYNPKNEISPTLFSKGDRIALCNGIKKPEPKKDEFTGEFMTQTIAIPIPKQLTLSHDSYRINSVKVLPFEMYQEAIKRRE